MTSAGPLAGFPSAGPAVPVGAHALLAEIATLLQRLAETGEGGAIDLRSLPLGPTDYLGLREALGEGEVVVRLDLAGRSTVRETAVAGVWWVEHRDGDGRLLAELVEVTPVPAIVAAQPADIECALAGLRRRVARESEREESAQ